MSLRPFLKTVMVSVVLCLCAATARAEPYVGTDFPPNEVILKTSIGFHSLRNAKILGKIGKDNAFTVFVQDQHDNILVSIMLMRLDTNMWVYQSKHYDPRNKRVVDGYKVLEK